MVNQFPPQPPRWVMAIGGEHLRALAPVLSIYMQRRRVLYKGLLFGGIHAVGTVVESFLLKAALTLGPWGAILLVPATAHRVFQERFIRPRSQEGMNTFADTGTADLLKHIGAAASRRRPLDGDESRDLQEDCINIRNAWRNHLPWMAIHAMGAGAALVGTFLVVSSIAFGVSGVAFLAGLYGWVGVITYRAAREALGKQHEVSDLAKISRRRLSDLLQPDGWSLFQRTSSQYIAQQRLDAAVEAEATTRTAADEPRTKAGSMTSIAMGIFTIASVAWAVLAGTPLLAIPLIALAPAIHAAALLPDNILGAIPGIESARRVSQFLNKPSIVQEMPNAINLHPHLYQGISLDRVTYAYGNHVALNNVSLSIRPGEVVAIIGPNGSGKSTMLDILHRLRDPSFGRVTIDGLDLRSASRWSIDRLVAKVNQKPCVLEDMSVRQNILFGDLNATDAQLRDACRRTGLDGWLAKHGNDLNTLASGLSGGERQRLELARMLLHPGSLLLLDEPSTALDRNGIFLVQQRINEARAMGKAVVVVTHDPTLLESVDRVIGLDEGRIVKESRSRSDFLNILERLAKPATQKPVVMHEPPTPSTSTSTRSAYPSSLIA